jgi:hypothetical protein
MAKAAKSRVYTKVNISQRKKKTLAGEEDPDCPTRSSKLVDSLPCNFHLAIHALHILAQ